MQSFNCQCKLQQATLMLLMDHSGNERHKAKLLKNFRKLDVDNNGTLSHEELMKGYSMIMSEEEAKI
jgi:Ca2+-binding EF-hand superfamily protein